MANEYIWNEVFDQNIYGLTIKQAIDNGYMQPMICGNIDKYSCTFKMYGNYDNNYVLVGAFDGSRNYYGLCFTNFRPGEKNFLDSFYDYFLGLPARNYSKIVFFDISKNSPNFIDNLVVVPSCICVSDENENGFCLQTVDDFVFNNLGKNFINNKTHLGKAVKPEEVLERAKTMLQILSAFNYDLATEQEKDIMSALRKQTVNLLKENFTKERGALMSLVKKEIGDNITDALTFVESSGVMRRSSVLLRKDSIELLAYLKSFNSHIKKGSLTENIIYCEKVLEKFNERVDKRKQQEEIKKQIVEQKQNKKNKKFESKNKTERDENYRL